MCQKDCGKIHGAIGLVKVALQQAGFQIDVCPAAIVKQRRDVCRVCEFATRNADPKYAAFGGLTNLSQCKECDCIIIAKTLLASEACPRSKWAAVTLDEDGKRTAA